MDKAPGPIPPRPCLPAARKNNSLLSRGFLLLAFLVTAINFLAMPRMIYGGDSARVRYEAITLINTGSIAIPADVASFGEKGQYFFYNASSDKWVSKYGILNTLLCVPPLAVEKLLTGHLDFKTSSVVLVFNAFNILCALVTAAWLFKFAGLYTESLFAKTAFILSAFYCTFWWNHIRLQSFEAYQPFLLIGATYHFIRACNSLSESKEPDRDSREKNLRRNLLCSGLLLGLLWLSKALYLLVAPLFVLLLVVFEWPHLRAGGKFNAQLAWKRLRVCVIWLGAPLLLCFAALLAVNAFKFGSPFDNGYTQWTREQHLFSGNLLEGVMGFLVDPQFSIFLTFPVLIVALAGLPAFLRNYRMDAVVIYSLALLLLLVNAKFPNWRGLWSYGPRYMLPALGMMSLPFVPVIDRIVKNRRTLPGLCAALAVMLVLGYSAYLQCNVNAIAFNAFFQIKEKLIDPVADRELDSYFANTHFGIVCGDIIAHKHGRPLWFRDRFAQVTHDPRALARLDQYLAVCSASNYYLFPDPAPRASGTR